MAEKPKKRVTSFSQFDQGEGTAAAQRGKPKRTPQRPPAQQTATAGSATVKTPTTEDVLLEQKALRRRTLRLGL